MPLPCRHKSTAQLRISNALSLGRQAKGYRKHDATSGNYADVVATSDGCRAGGGCLRIRRAFRKQGIQPFVVTIDIIEKVHSTVFLRNGGYVENKDRDLHCQINLPIVFA
jgi:hypothetical protein